MGKVVARDWGELAAGQTTPVVSNQPRRWRWRWVRKGKEAERKVARAVWVV